MGKIAKFLSSLVLAGVFVACDESGSSSGGNGLRYPISRSLTNTDGKVVEVTIVGSTGSELIFEKAGESKRYRYPFHKLSEGDQKFAEKLPIKTPKKRYEPKDKLDKAKVDGLQASIDRAIASAEALVIEHQHPSMMRNPTRQRSVERKIEERQWEINSLRKEYKALTGGQYGKDFQFRTGAGRR